MEINNFKPVFSDRSHNRILKLLKTILILLLLGSLNLLWVKADDQQRRVTGTITHSKTGDALPGVNVVIQGTVTGTVTDVNGSYSINVPGPASVLTFSFLGYVSQSITVGNQSVVNVSLSEELTALDEVVVVGYGTELQINLTGSVGAVRGSEITNRRVPNVQNLLAGKVSGLQVVQRGENQETSVGNMRIRGIGTFSSAGNNPLILIDGVEGNISYLDPDNIENVSVLKDAASASIYGARGCQWCYPDYYKKRQGRGDISVEYHVTVQAQNPTRLPTSFTIQPNIWSIGTRQI